eukprot:3570603-Rhodomonas_salina.1
MPADCCIAALEVFCALVYHVCHLGIQAWTVDSTVPSAGRLAGHPLPGVKIRLHPLSTDTCRKGRQDRGERPTEHDGSGGGEPEGWMEGVWEGDVGEEQWGVKWVEAKPEHERGTSEAASHPDADPARCSATNADTTTSTVGSKPGMEGAAVGKVGEVWVGGVQVCREYLNARELTAAKFVVWNTEWWFRTGDLGRWVTVPSMLARDTA